MARRTSSRAASHDQASSPPKPDASRRTVRSPQKRSTRATRSQSRDLDEPYAPDLRQGGGRNERQGSVDSVGSDASTANNSRGKKLRGNAPIQTDLSMVAEDEEMQESLRNEAEAREFPNVHQHPEPMSGLSEIPHPAPAAKKSLLPAAQIRSTSRGNSNPKRLTGLSYLMSKKPQASAAPPSDQQQLQQQVAAGPSAPKTPQNNVTRQLPLTAPAKTSQEEHPEADDNSPFHFSNEDFANKMTEYDAEKNKENRPLPAEAIPQTLAATLPANPQRKSFIERQPSAHRVSQISDSDADSQPEPTARQHAKRAREEPEEVSEHEVEAAMDEDEISEDDGFEQDLNQLPSRFREPPPEVIQVTGGARKRARIPSRVVSHGPAGEVQSRQPRIEAKASRLPQQPSSSRVQGRNSVVSPIEEELNNGMKAYREAQHQATQYDAAREMAAQQAQARLLNIGAHRPTQRRTKWTQDEEAGFIDLIGRFGVGWAALHARGQAEGIFDECRNQGSLKDKARNMKVDFLISGSPLPTNFDLIAIGQKERDKVMSRGRNPYRKEGEIVGQEAIDMDGQPRGVFD
ncbi:hypothetical protein V501_10079 [Pseudogymnoascus sp. VKM F-4519 (FW-2642)]|nr:hypothetical protein V501_10079 [Pseudogymnoascus sp. VKM F-4519 (FW-2642)]